jgi:hypothetical protein
MSWRVWSQEDDARRTRLLGRQPSGHAFDA